MEDDLSEDEREQLRRLAVMQRVARVILLKWGWFLACTAVASFLAFAALLVLHFATSNHRFDAKTQLLYNPRKVARIDSMSDKQLLSVLNRNSIKRRVGTKQPMDDAERSCLVIDLDIVQEKRQSNIFSLTAHAPSWTGAVRKVNAYAEALIEEYVNYRTRDLGIWRESLAVRKKAFLGHISEIEGEESVLKGKIGVASPVETLAMINGLLSDQRKNLSMLSVQMANEEKKHKKLEENVGTVGAAISANAAVIRQKSAEIAALDRDIAKLREIYTDLNPKVIGKLDERKAMLDSYTAFLAEKGIAGVDVATIDRLEKSAGELAESSLKLDVLAENHNSLEREIAENEKRSKDLTEAIPAFERLRVRREDQEQALRELDDQLENIAYLEMAARNDLQQIERAGGASDSNPLQIRNFLVAVGGSVASTLVLAFWILAIELVFGKVHNGKEMAAYDEMVFIGSLPEEGAMKEEEEKDVLGVVSLKFANADLPKGIVLECRLPGAAVQPKFRAALAWSLAMSGAQAFALEIVSGDGFTPPEGSEPMLSAVRKGLNGWFPVANRYALAPTELQMLQADLAELRTQYDHVFVFMPDGVRRGGSFFDQLMSVCDSVVLVAGAGVTPRSWFSYARHHIQTAKKPMMGLIVGAPVKDVRKEMEATK